MNKLPPELRSLEGAMNMILGENNAAPQPVEKEELISRIFRAFGITDYPMNRKMMHELVWSAEKIVAEAEQIAAAPVAHITDGSDGVVEPVRSTDKYGLEVAFEAGYKACERGENLQFALEAAFSKGDRNGT